MLRGLAAACAAVLAIPAAPAAAQAPTAALTKWNEISSAVITGERLLALDTESVRVRGRLPGGRPGPVQFTYHRTDLIEVALTRDRLRFGRAAFSTVLAIRTSIGPLAGARLMSGADGATVTLPGGRDLAPPVVWCCTPAGTEVVVESDGREAAPRAFAAGLDGTRVRMLMRGADGGVTLVSASPGALGDPDWVDESRTSAPFPGAPAGRLAAIADGVVAWSESPESGLVRRAVPTDAGIGPVTDVRLPGRVLELWAVPGTLVALTRSGGAVRVARIDLATGAVRVVWRGTRTPRVAVGGGTVAVADGRRILAGRGALSRVAQARGPVPAVAADGDRVAWFERLTIRRGGAPPARWTVARMGRVAR